jgi:hypothetical protein
MQIEVIGVLSNSFGTAVQTGTYHYIINLGTHGTRYKAFCLGRPSDAIVT